MIQKEGEERKEKSGRGNRRSSKNEMENLYENVDNLEKAGRKNVILFFSFRGLKKGKARVCLLDN